MFSYRTALIRLVCGLCLFACGGGSAEAAKCTVSTTPIVFGTYNVFTTAPSDSTATLVYNCNGGARNVVVAITRGGSATFSARELAKGSERLVYNLFRDAARSTIWGDMSGGTSAYLNIDPPNGQDITLTMFGRIPPGQDISAGAYTDTVTVAIEF